MTGDVCIFLIYFSIIIHVTNMEFYSLRFLGYEFRKHLVNSHFPDGLDVTNKLTVKNLSKSVQSLLRLSVNNQTNIIIYLVEIREVCMCVYTQEINIIKKRAWYRLHLVA